MLDGIAQQQLRRSQESGLILKDTSFLAIELSRQVRFVPTNTTMNLESNERTSEENPLVS
jgi:hypothetical protein